MKNVYLISASDESGKVLAYKIGIAGDVASRLRSLQTASHLFLCVEATFVAFDYTAVEAMLHSICTTIRGEWVKPDPYVSEYFMRCKYVFDSVDEDGNQAVCSSLASSSSLVRFVRGWDAEPAWLRRLRHAA